MSIDAKTVAELRKRTGLPMMKCKKALQEAGGDLEAAADNLRKQGVKASEKVAARELVEGLVFLHSEGNAACAVSIALSYVAYLYLTGWLGTETIVARFADADPYEPYVPVRHLALYEGASVELTLDVWGGTPLERLHASTAIAAGTTDLDVISLGPDHVRTMAELGDRTRVIGEQAGTATLWLYAPDVRESVEVHVVPVCENGCRPLAY